MGVELSPDTHRRIEELCSHIADDTKSVISFDIFDTLVCRPTLIPKDIFLLVEAVGRDRLNNPALQFYKIRVEAERMARQDKNGGEITFEEIYEKIVTFFKISGKSAQILKDIELSTELDLIQARPIGRKLFDEALRQNKKIILVSDMYLPDEFIEKLLHKCSFHAHHKLYVSASCKATKHSGDLYGAVLADQNIAAGELVHFGDNITSDIENARKQGIDAHHIPKAVDVFWRFAKNRKLWKRRSKKTELGMRLSLGLAVNQVFDTNIFDGAKRNSHFDGNPYILGFYAAGPWLLTLTKWIMDEAISDGFNDIYFVARDGKLPLQTFNALKPFYPDGLKGHYLHSSREMIYPLELNDVGDIAFNKSRLGVDRTTPIRELVTKRLCISITEDIKSYLLEKGYPDLDIPPENVEAFFLDCAGLSETILKSVAKQQEPLDKYYSSTIKDPEKSVLFDIGFTARLQRLLSARLSKPINAYYMMSVSAAAQTYFSSSISKNFLFPPRDHRRHEPKIYSLIFELLISDIDRGSCLAVTENDDGDFKFHFDDEKMDEAVFATLKNAQTGALDFVNQYIQVFGKYLSHLDILPMTSLRVLEDYSRSPSKIDAKILQNVTIANSMVGHTIKLIDPITSNSHWKPGAAVLNGAQGTKKMQKRASSISWSPILISRKLARSALTSFSPLALPAFRNVKSFVVQRMSALVELKSRALLKLRNHL